MNSRKPIRTASDLAESTEVMLTASEVGAVLGMHPQTLNLKAKMGDLPFPYIRSGNRTKIPRLGLMRWLGMEVTER